MGSIVSGRPELRKISQAGLDLIKSFEGLRLESYRDSVGILTWGWGHTGPDVRPGQTITTEHAAELLRQDVFRFEVAVNDAAKVGLSQSQFDALVCFSFNVGAEALRTSTLLKLINASDFAGAAQQFRRWTRAGKVELAGLVRRRAAERDLFLS